MASGVFVWVYLGYFLVPTKKSPGSNTGTILHQLDSILFISQTQTHLSKLLPVFSLL